MVEELTQLRPTRAERVGRVRGSVRPPLPTALVRLPRGPVPPPGEVLPELRRQRAQHPLAFGEAQRVELARDRPPGCAAVGDRGDDLRGELGWEESADPDPLLSVALRGAVLLQRRPRGVPRE